MLLRVRACNASRSGFSSTSTFVLTATTCCSASTGPSVRYPRACLLARRQLFLMLRLLCHLLGPLSPLPCQSIYASTATENCLRFESYRSWRLPRRRMKSAEEISEPASKPASRSSTGALEGYEQILSWFKSVSGINRLTVLTHSITASVRSLRRVNPTAATVVFGESMIVAIKVRSKSLE